MQNFYELENLIEKKKLEEMGIKYMPMGKEGDRDQYADPFQKGWNVSASDKYTGRTSRALPDPGAQVPDIREPEGITKWKQENPDQAAAWDQYHQATSAERGAAKAASRADDVDQHVIRKGTGVKDVVRTTQNDMRMKLSDIGTPDAMNALKIQAALFQPQYFGKTFALPDLFKLIAGRTKLGLEEIKPALLLLRQVSGNQTRIFKGVPYPKLHIVDPFTIGGAGSAPETPDVDAEDALTATGGAQYATSSIRDPGPAGDQYKGRSASSIRDPGVAGGPLNLAPQVDSKWAELKSRANKAVLDEMPDLKEIKHLIDDLNNHVNDLKSTATENPDAKAEIEEAAGFVKALKEIGPQREWFEIFESMCLNGI